MFQGQSRWLGGVLAATTAGLLAPAGTTAMADDFGPSFEGGIDWTNKYFFRGILQEDSGLILQPWGQVTVPIHEADGMIVSAVDASAGIWASIHSEQTDAMGMGPDVWYETDFYFNVGANFMDDFRLDLTYTAYTSPSGAFSTIQELSLGMGYDDSGLWNLGNNFGINPYALVAYELYNRPGDIGTYAELGIEPGLDVEVGLEDALALSFPVRVGLSIDDYYFDDEGSSETFGFLEIGAMASMPLDQFVPEAYGSWSVNAGVSYLRMGSGTAHLNDDDRDEILGTVGLGMSF